MEGLIFLLILYWIIKAVVGKGKRAAGAAKRTKKKPLHEEGMSAAAHRAERAARMQEEIQRRQHKRAAKAAHAQPEPRQTVMGEGTEGFSAYRPLQHRMTQASSHMDYEGSLGGGSTEGIDTCDPELEHGVHWQPEADSVYAGEIGGEPLISLSPRAMMQGVVMSEILTRPARRVRR